MNIFVNGSSGKMGSILCNIIDTHEDFDLVRDIESISISQAVIDFSHPSSTIEILELCKSHKTPIIIGTTGFTSDEKELIKDASSIIPIIFASNMSMGIKTLKENIILFLKDIKETMKCNIHETHHKEKIDQPSGTALELENIIKTNDVNDLISSISIKSTRKDNIFGHHRIHFYNEVSSLYFIHEALSRKIFAIGALECSRLITSLDPKLYKFDEVIN